MIRLTDYIEQSNTLDSRDGLFALLAKVASGYGFDRIAYGALTEYELYGIRDEVPAVAYNYPEDWARHYFANGFERLDPVIQYSPAMRSAFTWSLLLERFELSRQQRRIMHQCAEAGMKDGVTVPLHGPHGNVAAISFASSAGGTDAARHLSVLHVIASQFHTAWMTNILGDRYLSPQIHLTNRERDCLSWSARGKSSTAIAEMLRVSPHTVDFHLKGAMAKLGTSNRIVAVVKALRLGLIVP